MKVRFAILAILSCAAAHASELQDARSILQSVDASKAVTRGEKSVPAQLLADIQRFRSGTVTGPADRMASEWFALLDRAMEIRGTDWSGDFEAYDADVRQVVGVASVLAALPPPEAWPALRARAKARAVRVPQDVDALAVRLLSEALTDDPPAIQMTLSQIATAVDQMDREQRQRSQALLVSIRGVVAQIYGTPADIVAGFEASLDSPSPNASWLEVPDLVGLVGESRSIELLRKAVAAPVYLQIESGERTRALARRVALDNAGSMRVPQWGLVTSIDARDLYETLQQRFGNVSSEDDGSMDAQSSAFAPFRGAADTYYLLSTIIAGQQLKAEKALLALTRNGRLSLPRDAVQALRKAGHEDALVTFLHAMLEKRPDVPAWDVYIDQSAEVGRSDEALGLVQELLKRRDLPQGLRTELQMREADALLAADRVDGALAIMKRQVAKMPTAKDESRRDTTKTAIRLAEVGILLNRPQDVQAGLSYAEASFSMTDDVFDQDDRTMLLTRTYAALRRAGRTQQAQALAVRELHRQERTADGMYEQYGVPAVSRSKRAALVELAAIFSAEDRHQDVLTLLEDSKQWGARDLAEFITEPDSMKTPVGMIAARALKRRGDRDAALRVLRALLDKLPGYDPAYAMLVELDAAGAIAEFEARYAQDQFEERPLIWIATAQAAEGHLDAAESTIRRAIAIDPSDGEEGPNDRLRAYAVLADVLAAKGNAKDAAAYRKAIDAIRLSEEADLFHAAGLYTRAFALYRQALDSFSDAYCIQSRLAIQLSRRGRHAEALVHYRRAYELMPDSFGRVESHCFGCESVFEDSTAQSVAEEVFLRAIERDRNKPQSHYLLGYLREQQGRFEEALQLYRTAVTLDDSYLNAWNRLHGLTDKTYVDAQERDIILMKLLRLDPAQRHVHYDTSRMRNFAEVWREIERSTSPQRQGDAFRLNAAADMYDAALVRLPPEIRVQMTQYLSMIKSYEESYVVRDPRRAMLQHVIVQHVQHLLGAEGAGPEMDY